MPNPFTEIRLATTTPQHPGPLTRQEFATALGVGYNTVYSAEQGAIPPPEILIQALARLGHDPDRIRDEYEAFRSPFISEARDAIRDVAKA